jgi:hypothetical protein
MKDIAIPLGAESGERARKIRTVSCYRFPQEELAHIYWLLRRVPDQTPSRPQLIQSVTGLYRSIAALTITDFHQFWRAAAAHDNSLAVAAR